jgi:hypothetical protein
MLNGSYLLAILILFSLVLWPEETQVVFTSISLKVQLYWINWRLKRQARKAYDLLVSTMTTPLYNDYDFEHGGSGWWEKLSRGWHEMYVYAPPIIDPPEFNFVDIWDRDPLD